MSDVIVILELNLSAEKDLPMIMPCVHHWKRYDCDF